jgi:hypothetical protein
MPLAFPPYCRNIFSNAMILSLQRFSKPLPSFKSVEH